MSDDRAPPRAVVFGCAGPGLSDAERRFFADADPLGFILFERNVETPRRLGRLIAELRAAVGRADAPVLIDQEGGRVARLRPPHWRAPPAASRFGELFAADPGGAAEAVRLNARLIAGELGRAGITVDCTPVLDVPEAGAHEVIGDRAFSGDPAAVAVLGRAACDGLMAGGILPVLKHIPGHGRARADSHVRQPVVEATLAELEARDFAPFRALADMPWAMTAHVVYAAVDSTRPATVSRRVIDSVIRGAIGFQGVLISDDLVMAALAGSPGERAAAAIAAGCDVVLHCNGDIAQMRAVAAAVGRLGEAGLARLRGAAERLSAAPARPEPDAAQARLDTLMAAA